MPQGCFSSLSRFSPIFFERLVVASCPTTRRLVLNFDRQLPGTNNSCCFGRRSGKFGGNKFAAQVSAAVVAAAYERLLFVVAWPLIAATKTFAFALELAADKISRRAGGQAQAQREFTSITGSPRHRRSGYSPAQRNCKECKVLASLFSRMSNRPPGRPFSCHLCSGQLRAANSTTSRQRNRNSSQSHGEKLRANCRLAWLAAQQSAAFNLKSSVASASACDQNNKRPL